MRNPLYIFLLFAVLIPGSVYSEFYLPLDTGWTFQRSQVMSPKYPATVPGTIHTDLFANGIIPDPFQGTNESRLQWIDSATWIYEVHFDCSRNMRKERHLEMQFDGLDTYCSVYLNGELILNGEDMFMKYAVDVKKYIKAKNTLIIRFDPAYQLIEKNKMRSTIKNYPGGDRVFIRKAQYQFGWDWGPKFVTCGIWKPIRLYGWSDMRISDAVYKLDYLDKDTAFMTVDFIYEADRAGRYQFLVFSNDSAIYSDFYSVGKNKPEHLKITFKIVRPKLWWCNGLGEPYLYRFTLATFRGKKLCLLSTVSGIRKIEMSNDSKNDGSFSFLLNDKPIYINGTNWIPSDNFLPRVPKSKINAQLTDMRDLYMNMVRVWGGGVYESDYFYARCDSLGLLVWQDLPFACSMYPYEILDKDNLLTKEVTQNVRRIASHPSIAVWCGDNENKEGWFNWGWQKQFGYSAADSAKIYNDYFNYSLKFMDCVAKYDPFFPYITSSPQNGWGRDVAYERGDVHYWGVWWGMEPFTSYEDHTGRFVSEFGFQGAPSLHTFKQMGADVSKWFSDSTIVNHQKHPTGYETIQTYMKRDYGIIPQSFEDFVYLSQVLQKDAMDVAIESQRINSPNCRGSMFWQYNDCWPGTSWSVQDYFGRKKLAWYELRRLYYPELLSIKETQDSVFVWLSEQSNWPLRLKLYINYTSFTGTKYIDIATDLEPVPNSTRICWRESKQKLIAKAPLNESYLYCVLAGPTGSGFPGFISATKLFGKSADLKLPDTPIEYTFSNYITEGPMMIAVKSGSFQSNVMILCDDPNTTFSDNGFNLYPGRIKQIVIESNKSERELTESLHFVSMNQLVNKQKAENK